MKIGRLRHKGTIEQLVKSQDAAGGKIENWVKFADVWCDITQLNGTEKYVSHEKHATATHQSYIRYVPCVKTDMRLVCREREFGIVSAPNINERDRTLQLILEEKLDE